ncbi:MAG TPA: hypothetical protein VKB18_04025 [Gemmatimonadota bacterium]|nr:hypothetical protein [Gemmatimonadota bacterium]
MRTSSACAVLLMLGLPLAAHGQEPQVVPVPPSGPQSAAWRMRMDDPSGSVDRVHLEPAEDGAHISTRAAAIFWRPADTASGTFTARATFHARAGSSRREGYGLLVGGRDLAGPDQAYLYFLVRGDGSWLVKRRTGAETGTLSGGWQHSEAVAEAGEGGEVSHALAVSVGAESVLFLVDGRRVGSVSRDAAGPTDGIVGLRVNHRLDVEVTGPGVRPEGASQ